MQFDCHLHRFRLTSYYRMHIKIWLDAYPSHAAWIMAQVNACSRADLYNRAPQNAEQTAFAFVQ